MDALQIFLLGSPEVVWKGETLKISRRMSRALLFYLALASRVSRSDLRALFWPDEEDEDKARANLRVALARLRAGLPDPELLIVDMDTITLDRERVSVDVQQFLELAEPALRAAGLIALETALPERLAQSLRQAASLWRTPHFFAGFSLAEDSPELDHWQSATTQRLEGLYLRVVTRLADHFTAAGDLDSALHWVQDGLLAEPWADDLHIRMLRWLLALGRSAAATAHAQTLLERFAEENLEISVPLAALVSQVRQGGGAAALPEPQDWPVARQVALVGRADHLQSLGVAFRRGGLTVLWGEAGVGKSRLAYEFYRSLQPRPRLLLLNCRSGGDDLSFQPLIDALRSTIRREEWQRLKPVWLQRLALLLPELSESRPMALEGEALPVELLRGHVFEALRQLLLEISRSGRLLVVLDGAQWCDRATLAALAYLNDRRLFQERGLLLVLVRSEERGSVFDHRMLAERGIPVFHQLKLRVFDRVETADLARRVLDQVVPDGGVQRLLEETGGNPLFLLEMLFALLEDIPTVGLEKALVRLPVGGSFRRLLYQRLARLAPVVRQVADAAAVLQGEFDPAVLAAVLQMDLETVAQALDELIKGQLIQPVTGRSMATYEFIHPQTREMIGQELGIAHLRLLHLRGAQVLAAQEDASQDQAARLAYHYEQAGELLPAFHCWLRAGRDARGRYAIAEAQHAFQAAERLVPILKERLADEILYQLYSVWGETILYDFKDTPDKQQIYHRLLQLGEERHSPLLIGSALSALADLVSFQREPAETLATFERAAYQLEWLSDPVPAAQNEYRQGWFLIRLMRYGDAALLLEKGLARLEKIMAAPQELRANLSYRLGMAYLLRGWPGKAQQWVAHALGQTQSPGDIYGHLVLARAKFFLGEHAAAREHVRLGLLLATALDSPRLLGLFGIYQFDIDLATGDVDAVWEHTQSVIELAQARGMPDVVCMALSMQGDIYRLLGDPQAAIRACQAALAVGRGRWDSLTAQYHLGMALVSAGQVEEGFRQIEEAISAARQLDLGVVYLPAMTARAFLLAMVGRLDEALELIPELTQMAEERPFFLAKFCRALVWALDAIRRVDERAARQQIEDAIQIIRLQSNPFWELYCYRILARLGPLGKAETARARELLDLVARRTRDSELRALLESFLASSRFALFGGS